MFHRCQSSCVIVYFRCRPISGSVIWFESHAAITVVHYTAKIRGMELPSSRLSDCLSGIQNLVGFAAITATVKIQISIVSKDIEGGIAPWSAAFHSIECQKYHINVLNLPQTLKISSATNTYTYAADGRKLKTVLGGSKTTDKFVWLLS
jgi:hypothetical protein